MNFDEIPGSYLGLGAIREAADGRMDAQSLYSVVAHNRFIEDLTDKVPVKMFKAFFFLMLFQCFLNAF